MTICAILFGLLPIMWSPTTQSGADVMKRIAAPMIGGVVTSGILELLIYPAIYVIWRRRYLPKERRNDLSLTTAAEAPTSAAGPAIEKPKPNKLLRILLLIAVFAGLLAGGYFAWQNYGKRAIPIAAPAKPLATQTVNGLTVNLIGELRNGQSEILIDFRDATGQLVDVGTVKFDLDMNMPGMVMHSGSMIEATGTPGQYRAKVKPDMGGDWTGTVTYEGPRGSGKVNFSVNVKP